MKTRSALVPFALLAVLSLCACNDDSAQSPDFAAVEGIYQLTGYTDNESACSEGPDLLSERSDTLAVMAVAHNAYVGDYLVYALCDSDSACAALAAAIKANRVYSSSEIVNFTQGNSTSGFAAQVVGTGYWHSDGTCTEGNLRTVSLKFSGTDFAYNEEIQMAKTFPVDAEGYCTTDNTQKNLSPDCTQMKTMEGRYLKAL